MIDKINDQVQKSLEPVMSLVNANAEALQQLASQQGALFTSLMEDSASFAQGATEIKDLEGLVEAQKAYAEEVQQKITAAAKEAYDVISGVQEKTGEVLQSATQDAVSSITNLTK